MKIIFNTYNKNDISLFASDIVKICFYCHDKFGLLYTYVIYNICLYIAAVVMFMLWISC